MGKKKKQDKLEQEKIKKQKKQDKQEQQKKQDKKSEQKDKKKQKKQKVENPEKRVGPVVDDISALQEETVEKVSSARPGRRKKTEKSAVVTADNRTIAEVFRAFSDESRLQILDLLLKKELCAGEILQSVNIVQSTLSHHMKILVETGIVNCRREGKKSIYSIDRDALLKAGTYLKKWS